MFSYGQIIHSYPPFCPFFCLDNPLLASCRYLMSSFAFFNLIDLLLGIEYITDNFFIQTWIFYTFILSTNKQNQIKPEDTTSSFFSPWVFLVIKQSYRDVPLLETSPFLLKEPPCQKVKMFFLAKIFKLSKLVVHFWRSMNHINIVIWTI